MALRIIDSFHTARGKAEREIMLIESPPKYPIFVLSHTQRRRLLCGVL